MRSLFRQICPNGDDAEARCLLAASLFIGNALIVDDGHDGRSRTQVIDYAVAKLLESE